MTKILQYNCQSLRANGRTLEYFLNNRDFDIAILSEIFSHSEVQQQTKLINFNIIRKNRPDGYGGVAIAFRKSVRFRRIIFSTRYDVMIAQTTNLSTNLVICSVYFEPNILIADFAVEMQRLLTFLESFDGESYVEISMRELVFGVIPLIRPEVLNLLNSLIILILYVIIMALQHLSVI